MPTARRAAQNITCIGLVLAPRPARSAWLRRVGAGLLAMLLGAAASDAHWRQQLGPLEEQLSAARDHPLLRQQLEQSQLRLRVSEARSLELERQVESLLDKLREHQDELSFFRKGRGKPP
jgi:hypothetical protein